MLQLSWDIFCRDREREWPSPNRVVVYIRSAARFPKAAVKFFLQWVKRRSAGDTDADLGEEKTAEKALEAYRQVLQNTFGSSELLDDVMIYVRLWIDGL